MSQKTVLIDSESHWISEANFCAYQQRVSDRVCELPGFSFISLIGKGAINWVISALIIYNIRYQ